MNILAGDCGKNIHREALSKSFGRLPYESTKSESRIPDASLACIMSTLFKKRIMFVFCRSLFDTIDVQIW